MMSALKNPDAVSQYLTTAGPFEEAKRVDCSPFGVIPKKSKPGKWRLILDICPRGQQCE